jgi:GntR family transcriptional regulator
MSDNRLEEFLTRYHSSIIMDLPKYAQLRESMIAAIDDGFWKSGDQIPNESTLAAVLPYSLGTVQKALRELVQARIIVRKHGFGTFVSDAGSPLESPMHLLFQSEDNKELPVYPKIAAVETEELETDGDTVLGRGVKRITRVDRVFKISDKVSCFSHFYVDSKRFPFFESDELKEFEASNFKGQIYRRYNVAISKMQQFMRWQEAPEHIAQHLNVPAGTPVTVLEFLALGTNDRPLYYQKAFVPFNSYRLSLGGKLDDDGFSALAAINAGLSDLV